MAAGRVRTKSALQQALLLTAISLQMIQKRHQKQEVLQMPAAGAGEPDERLLKLWRTNERQTWFFRMIFLTLISTFANFLNKTTSTLNRNSPAYDLGQNLCDLEALMYV